MKPILKRFLLLLAIVNAAGVSNLSSAASIGICSTQFEFQEGMSSKEFYSANGERQLLVVSDTTLDPDLCESSSVPQPAASILWTSLLPAQLTLSSYSQVILQGSFSAQSAEISEIITPEPPPTPTPSPSPPTSPSPTPTPTPVVSVAVETNTHTEPEEVDNALSNYESVLFGIEERAHWLGGYQLECSTGEQVAGIQLKANSVWPKNRRLQINASGTGEFQIAIADEQGIANESTVPIGTVRLNGVANLARNSFALPENPTPWQAITFICPQNAASLHIESITLQPAFDDSANSSRGAWVWNPSTWLNDPNFFWSLQNLESISEFYITVPTNPAGEVASPQQLSAFVRAANEKNIRIWAVIGDRHDVLPESLSLLQTRVSAYRRYNTRVEGNAKLAGVQLDIEPYLLPGHILAKDLWRERYLQTVSAAKQIAGESLHVNLVMPVWWGDHANWGPKLLNELTLPGISLTIMNYRTDHQQLLDGMTPFLEWGLRNQQAVRVALETGTLGDETQRSYGRNSDEGELWHLQIGSTPILVLFDKTQQDLEGYSFSQRFERVFSADNLTFGGDQQRLNEASNRLNQELRTWSSFAGIALHGLDEVYAEQNDE